VLAADTGVALTKNSIDVFVGEGRMAGTPGASGAALERGRVRAGAAVQASRKRRRNERAAVPGVHAGGRAGDDQPAGGGEYAGLAHTPAESDTRVASLGRPEPAPPAPSAAAPVH